MTTILAEALQPDELVVSTETEDVRLYIDFGDGELDVRVLEIAKRRVRIAFEDAVPDGFVAGVVLRGATLAASEVRSINLRVTAPVIGAHPGGTVYELEAADDATRAALWLEIESLRGLWTSEDPSKPFGPPRDVPKVPRRGQHTEEARQERLDFVRSQTGHDLSTMSEMRLLAERLTGNIENLVGAIEIPVGLAGPLWFNGEHVQGAVYAPFATTEGALVASASRGARALTTSGGVRTRVLSQRMLRVPLFVLSDMRGAEIFSRWVSDHAAEIAAQTRKVSRHARLVSLEPRILGKMVHVSFVYETGDAAGQNMTTACTWHACQWLMGQMAYYSSIRFENFIIEANMSGDKKVNYNSFISGRGTRVVAEAFVSAESLERQLKVTPKLLLDAHHCFVAGSIHVGTVGHNINVSNVVGAVFAATGQDIACVHESSLAQLHLEGVEGGVHASVLLPALIVGTVGGGTHVGSQRDLLEMMECYGPGKSARLAEIIAGFALALDLSTLSAIASGQFATAHERLGRNRPVEWFQATDLTPGFFQRLMRESTGDDSLEVSAAHPSVGFEMGSSIITELTARKVNKLVGHLPFDLTVSRDGGIDETVEVLCKVKPLDDEVVLMVNSLANMCGGKLAAAYAKFQDRTGFKHCHARELGVYAQTDERFRAHMPAIHGIYRDDTREAYVVVMERLKGMLLMDTADDTSGWQRPHIEAAIDGIARCHSVWYGREDELLAQEWIGPVQTTAGMVEMAPLWEALEIHNVEEFPEYFTRRDLQFYLSRIRDLDKWWSVLEQMPRTLVHNDFNPRNVCLRPGPDNSMSLCAYDWELATVQVPQHDLAEFLAFTLSPKAGATEIDHYVEFHRQALQRAAGVAIDRDAWELGFRLSTYDLVLNRFALYMMAHTFRHYGFVEHVAARTRNLARHAAERGI